MAVGPYELQTGDDLSVIAGAVGMTLEEVERANPNMPIKNWWREAIKWNEAGAVVWIANGGTPVVIPDPLLISDGTAAAPSLAFTSDTDTGIYRAGANEIGFTAGGVELLSVGSADVDVVTGHLNVFSNTGSDTISLGEYSGGSNLAAIETSSFYALMGTGNGNDAAYLRTKGTGPLILGASHGSNLTIATGGAVTLSSDLTVGGDVIASDGSAAAPSLTFASDGDTGVFLPAANQLGFAAGGVELLRVGSADVDVMTGHLNLISNTGAQTMSLGEWSSGYDYAAVETPSMVVLMGNASDVNSQGFIRTKGTGSLNLGTNNSNDLTIANGGAVSTIGNITAGGDIVTAVGSAGAPSHTFTGFTTTGMFHRGTNEIAFATAGTENLRLTGSNLRMASATSLIYNVGYFRGVDATGTASLPTFAWQSDTNSGMYRESENVIAFSTASAKRASIYTGRIAVWSGASNTTLGVDSTWGRLETNEGKFYINREIWVDTGIIGSYNENLQLRRAGATKMTMTTTHNISNQKFKIDGPNVGLSAKTWTSSQFLIESLNSSGNDNSNSIVQMAFHNDRFNIAFNVRNYGPEGTTLGFTNSGNTAFIPIRASAFTVMSTIRIKQDIEAVEDADAIALAEKFLLTSFLPKVRPENVHLSEQFKAKNAEWIAASPENEELTPEAEDWESHDHDCTTDPCDGDADNPCQVCVNDTRRFGGLAEWWGDVAPEQVNFDGEGIADSIDMDQVATTALGATGALSRKLTAAMETIDSLQDRLAVLENSQ